MTGRLLAILDANSSQPFPLNRARPSPSVQEALSPSHAEPLGTFRASGGLAESLRKAECWMLEGEFDDAVDQVAPYLDALYETYLEAMYQEGANSMFARVVECQSKAGKGEQVGHKLKNDVLPILQKQPGFIDFLALSDKTNPERMVCISFWTSREDADRYHQHHYDTINDALRPILESPPMLGTFVVDVSTAHRIADDRAA